METKIELNFRDIKNRTDSKVVEFVGDLDATNVERVLEEIIGLLNSGVVHLIADFKELRYVNSTGLGILLHFSKTAKEKGGSFRITNVNEHVYEIIEIIGATTLLDIFENVEEALKTL